VLRTRPHDVVAVGLVVRHVQYAMYGGPRSGDEYAARIVLADGTWVEAADTITGAATAAIRDALVRHGVDLRRQRALFPGAVLRV